MGILSLESLMHSRSVRNKFVEMSPPFISCKQAMGKMTVERCKKYLRFRWRELNSTPFKSSLTLEEIKKLNRCCVSQRPQFRFHLNIHFNFRPRLLNVVYLAKAVEMVEGLQVGLPTAAWTSQGARWVNLEKGKVHCSTKWCCKSPCCGPMGSSCSFNLITWVFFKARFSRHMTL